MAFSGTILNAGDPPPVNIVNPHGRSSFLLIGDHAGNAIPSRLGTLGLGADDLQRHIAWDIGIAGLGARLTEHLDATFIHQGYSRLVIDCNRAPERYDAIAAVSDGTAIPGNAGLPGRAARIAEIHEPYHQAIDTELARRHAAGAETILVALHSFTPVFGGFDRPWQVGILHDAGDTAFAHACLTALRARGDLVVGDNEPYRMDGIDYTIPRHAYPLMRPYAEIEVRQDLLADEAGVAAWAALLADILSASLGPAMRCP